MAGTEMVLLVSSVCVCLIITFSRQSINWIRLTILLVRVLNTNDLSDLQREGSNNLLYGQRRTACQVPGTWKKMLILLTKDVIVHYSVKQVHTGENPINFSESSEASEHQPLKLPFHFLY